MFSMHYWTFSASVSSMLVLSRKSPLCSLRQPIGTHQLSCSSLLFPIQTQAFHKQIALLPASWWFPVWFILQPWQRTQMFLRNIGCLCLSMKIKNLRLYKRLNLTTQSKIVHLYSMEREYLIIWIQSIGTNQQLTYSQKLQFHTITNLQNSLTWAGFEKFKEHTIFCHAYYLMYCNNYCHMYGLCLQTGFWIDDAIYFTLQYRAWLHFPVHYYTDTSV